MLAATTGILYSIYNVVHYVLYTCIYIHSIESKKTTIYNCTIFHIKMINRNLHKIVDHAYGTLTPPPPIKKNQNKRPMIHIAHLRTSSNQ